MVAPLDFIAEMIQANNWDAFSAMHARCIPGLCVIFMGTYRRFKIVSF
jgi:hypothetical protein